jgi:hypothetical protein
MTPKVIWIAERQNIPTLDKNEHFFYKIHISLTPLF